MSSWKFYQWIWSVVIATQNCVCVNASSLSSQRKRQPRCALLAKVFAPGPAQGIHAFYSSMIDQVVTVLDEKNKTFASSKSVGQLRSLQWPSTRSTCLHDQIELDVSHHKKGMTNTVLYPPFIHHASHLIAVQADASLQVHPQSIQGSCRSQTM